MKTKFISSFLNQNLSTETVCFGRSRVLFQGKTKHPRKEVKQC